MIPFNQPYLTGKEESYLREVLSMGKLSGDGPFTKKCHAWLEEHLSCKKALLTHSCTAALEMAAILADIQTGDEVIMPSYTFVSTANAFVLRGGVPVFADIRPDTLNIDETKIEKAITEKTKAIVPVHYAGVACEMDTIMNIAEKHNLIVIEDAAQGVGASYRGKPLGSIGHMGCYSFHETKNIIAGEGGALIVNDNRFAERAEIIREKGTNRSKFLRGQVDKYTWVDIGSSFLPSELNAAFLFAQLEKSQEINQNRLQTWDLYHRSFRELEETRKVIRPHIPDECSHNAHLYYLLLESMELRDQLIQFLKEADISAVFHYIPLHSSDVGKKRGRVSGEIVHTDELSRRLVRLPMFCNLSLDDATKVIKRVREFFGY